MYMLIRFVKYSRKLLGLFFLITGAQKERKLYKSAMLPWTQCVVHFLKVLYKPCLKRLFASKLLKVTEPIFYTRILNPTLKHM